MRATAMSQSNAVTKPGASRVLFAETSGSQVMLSIAVRLEQQPDVTGCRKAVRQSLGCVLQAFLLFQLLVE
jgi:hypothetical protein